MKTIDELEDTIRDFINNPRKQYILLQNKASWNMLCSCLDLIGDTELAIAAYNSSTETEDKGNAYLLNYGILQTLFLQQDAVRNLCEALAITYEPDPILTQIREIRNDSIGHPTKRGGDKDRSYNFITRASICKTGFDLMTTYPDGRAPRFMTVNVVKLIENQQQLVANALASIVEMLLKEEADHKAMFKEDHLLSVFPSVLHYYFEKVFEAVHGNKPVEFGATHVKAIGEVVDNFKSKLERRGTLKAYDSVIYLLELLEYPIKELSSYFSGASSSIGDSKTAYIFTFFLMKHMDELKQIAKEIDEEYETK